jgi:hypothetical protein
MKQSLVQPITPTNPTPQVQAALIASAAANITPTQSSMLATVPAQSVSTVNSLLQPQNVAAILSQQAMTASSLSSAEKTGIGVVSGVAGVTLSQLSAPGQAMKPGSGDFVKSLQQIAPTLGFNNLASNTVMSGSFGVTSPTNLVNNVTAQVSAVTNSLQSSSTSLINAGILTGKETAIQSSGVVMAASIFGAGAVISALKSPSAVASSIGGNSSGIGAVIASGTYAAGLADKISSGVSGVANSISGAVSGGAKNLSSGITSFVNSASGGVKSLVTNFAGAAQNAFNLAEKSFGELRAGVANQLGGIKNIASAAPSKIVKLSQDVQVANDELLSAEKELADAARSDRRDNSAESRSAYIEAVNKVSAIEQRIKQLQTTAASGLGIDVGAQNINDLISPLNSSPSTANTGINALPGGLGAFAGQVGSAASNTLLAIKTAISDKAMSFGNLVRSVDTSVKSIVSKYTSVSSSVSGLADVKSGANELSSSVGSKINDAATKITSNLSASLDSLGNVPGKIKSSILAANTFPDKATINATLAKATSGSDSRIPPSTFTEFTPDTSPDEYQQAQVSAQTALYDLEAARDVKVLQRREYELALAKTLDSQYMTKLIQVNSEIATIDTKIKAAQATYDRIASYYA